MDSCRSKACQHVIEIDPKGTNTAAKCKTFAKIQAVAHRLTYPACHTATATLGSQTGFVLTASAGR